MAAYSADFSSERTAAEGLALKPSWDALIETSYLLVGDSQCAATGLVPNWYVPHASGRGEGATSCSGSGTPAAEFGSEAARTGWRFAAHWLLHLDARAASLVRRAQASRSR